MWDVIVFIPDHFYFSKFAPSNITRRCHSDCGLLIRAMCFFSIDYCNIVWGGTSPSNLDRIFCLQKRACKVILDYNVDNSFDSMQDLKILTVFERLFLRKAKFMVKVEKPLTPPYINEMFNLRNQNESLSLLRSTASSNYIPPRPRKEIFKQSIMYSGPIIWNSLPLELKSLNTVNSFHNFFIKWLKH